MVYANVALEQMRRQLLFDIFGREPGSPQVEHCLDERARIEADRDTLPGLSGENEHGASVPIDWL